jgi:peptide/nickel transport system ATP-binding protein
VEQGTADEAILNPKSDYTKRLLGDVPKIYAPWDFSGEKAGA